MFTTRNDLPLEVRQVVINLLNQSLADGFVLKSYAKQAHWNLKGPNFMELHKLFDDISGDLEGFTDDIAERIMALGGAANGTAQQAVASTLLPLYEDKVLGLDHVNQFSDRLALYGKLCRLGIDRCLTLKDNDTADLYTEISRGLDKKLWFLEAFIQA